MKPERNKPYSNLWARIVLYVFVFSYIAVIVYLLLTESINVGNLLVFFAFIFGGVAGIINVLLVRYQNKRRKVENEEAKRRQVLTSELLDVKKKE